MNKGNDLQTLSDLLKKHSDGSVTGKQIGLIKKLAAEKGVVEKLIDNIQNIKSDELLTIKSAIDLIQSLKKSKGL